MSDAEEDARGGIASQADVERQVWRAGGGRLDRLHPTYFEDPSADDGNERTPTQQRDFEEAMAAEQARMEATEGCGRTDGHTAHAWRTATDQWHQKQPEHLRHCPGRPMGGSGRQAARVAAAAAAAESAQQRADRLAQRVKTLQRTEQAAQVDPFPEGSGLRVRWNQYTFLALKIRGLWYTTGRTGPHRASWAVFVDWLATADTLTVTQMSPAGVHHLFGEVS